MTFLRFFLDAAVQEVRSEQETQNPARSRFGGSEEGNCRHPGLPDGVADFKFTSPSGTGGSTSAEPLAHRVHR